MLWQLVSIRFQVLFTPLPGFFSPFPHGTCSLSVTKEYLALGGGPPCFPLDFTCLVVLRILSSLSAFRLQDSYLLWLAFPDHSTKHPSILRVLQPQLLRVGLGSSRFARRYWGNRFFFLFLWVLRCFSSPGCLPVTMDSLQDVWILLHTGFPIRISTSLSLLAARRSFSQLTASFFGS